MNLIGGIDFNNSFVDFLQAELDGATDIVSTVVNGVRYVYVTGFNDSGIQVLRMAANGTLTAVSTIGLTNPYSLEVVVVGSERFLIATSPFQSMVSTFRIDDDGVGTDGHLVPVATYRNAPTGIEPTEGQGLLGSVERMAQVTVGGTTYIVTAAPDSDALAVFRVNANGTLTRTGSALDGQSASYFFDGALGIGTKNIGGSAYVFIGGPADDGISSFRINANGTLTFVNSVSGVNTPREILAASYNGRDLLFVADNTIGVIVVYEIGANGALTYLSQTPNFINGSFSGLSGLDVLEVDGVQFLLATVQNQDTVLVLSLDDADVPRIVSSLADAVELDGAFSVRVERFGDRVFLLVAAPNSDRVTVLEIGGGADPVLGTAGDDRIVGLNGDDDLIGQGGNDGMFGGAGDDVLSGGDGNDQLFGGMGNDVLVGGDLNDFLEGGEGRDGIFGGRGRDTIAYTTSAAGVDIDLGRGRARGGDAEGDQFTEVENAFGSGFNDVIDGSKARNLLRGLGGNDEIDGKVGDDTIDGGSGSDTLFGSEGNDEILGGLGGDSIFGGIDNDVLFGGANNDRLFGGDGDDVLNGDENNDTLDGGLGNDTLNGGTGNDVFVFVDGGGDDVVQQFELAFDRIDLSGTSLNSLADVQAAALTIAGNTFIVLDGNSAITLVGIIEAQLTVDNFIF
jgi:Ca2+-binding RTX toxin-like protein